MMDSIVTFSYMYIMYLLIHTPFNPLLSSCFLVVFSFAQRVLIHSHISACVCTCIYVWCLHAWTHACICRYVCMCVCVFKARICKGKKVFVFQVWFTLINLVISHSIHFLANDMNPFSFVAKKYNFPSVLTTFSSSCHWRLFPYLGYCECCSTLG